MTSKTLQRGIDQMAELVEAHTEGKQQEFLMAWLDEMNELVTVKRLRTENARLKRHIELRDHVDDSERECRRCGMVFCDCPGGKK